MTEDDIRWADAALLWGRGDQPRDCYDAGVFASLNAVLEAVDPCAACGHLPTTGDPLVLAEGFRIHLHHVRDESDGFYGVPFQAVAA